MSHDSRTKRYDWTRCAYCWRELGDVCLEKAGKPYCNEQCANRIPPPADGELDQAVPHTAEQMELG